MKDKLVIGNWKMNGNCEENQRLLAEALPELAAVTGVEVVVCPPFPYLAQVGAQLQGSPVSLGAQNVNAKERGAFTGEVSVPMLNDFECRFVLVGHSERRTLFGETDEMVAEKYAAALSGGVIPVLCVGETLEQRRAGLAENVIVGQLQAVASRVGGEAMAAGVIAYEPLWAIGTGESATPEQAQQIHGHIRQWLAGQLPSGTASPRLLYGGSLKADNAPALFAQPDIDGGLVGSAALEAQSFVTICRVAQACQ
ncbi:triose-phosphate isomerase [Azomonas macrocytogenes]|uniref:Triosephosphate isomerase n=1 Tax=Azomonas macrocytogenes TaxID=69962 RepID=A0A839T1V8_AZOMA|nr:triose-phosphate isomerase [Azomonas macrocytogenes]MBB3102600.1 triosephosphate isomerase [Azomonas macrocytogenes]